MSGNIVRKFSRDIRLVCDTNQEQLDCFNTNLIKSGFCKTVISKKEVKAVNHPCCYHFGNFICELNGCNRNKSSMPNNESKLLKRKIFRPRRNHDELAKPKFHSLQNTFDKIKHRLNMIQTEKFVKLLIKSVDAPSLVMMHMIQTANEEKGKIKSAKRLRRHRKLQKDKRLVEKFMKTFRMWNIEDNSLEISKCIDNFQHPEPAQSLLPRQDFESTATSKEQKSLAMGIKKSSLHDSDKRDQLGTQVSDTVSGNPNFENSLRAVEMESRSLPTNHKDSSVQDSFSKKSSIMSMLSLSYTYKLEQRPSQECDGEVATIISSSEITETSLLEQLDDYGFADTLPEPNEFEVTQDSTSDLNSSPSYESEVQISITSSPLKVMAKEVFEIPNVNVEEKKSSTIISHESYHIVNVSTTVDMPSECNDESALLISSQKHAATATITVSPAVQKASEAPENASETIPSQFNNQQRLPGFEAIFDQQLQLPSCSLLQDDPPTSASNPTRIFMPLIALREFSKYDEDYNKLVEVLVRVTKSQFDKVYIIRKLETEKDLQTFCNESVSKRSKLFLQHVKENSVDGPIDVQRLALSDLKNYCGNCQKTTLAEEYGNAQKIDITHEMFTVQRIEKAAEKELENQFLALDIEVSENSEDETKFIVNKVQPYSEN